jgi:hypothetical protein
MVVVPVPVRGTVKGLLGSLEVIVRVPVWTPTPQGAKPIPIAVLELKLTGMGDWALGADGEAREKPRPLTVIPVMLKGCQPAFRTTHDVSLTGVPPTGTPLAYTSSGVVLFLGLLLHCTLTAGGTNAFVAAIGLEKV